MSWLISIKKYFLYGKEPEDKFGCRKLKNRTARYTLINGELYSHSFILLYLKCLIEDEAKYALSEVYKSICRNHLGAQTIAHKLLQGDYY